MRRMALAAVFASLIAIGVAYASAFLPGGAPDWAPWVMAMAIALLMAATTGLGALRGGRLGGVWIPLAAILLLVGGGFWLALAMQPTDPADPALWLGLPRRAAVVLLGVGLLPLLFVPVGYALTFDATTFTEAALARIRGEVEAPARDDE